MRVKCAALSLSFLASLILSSMALAQAPLSIAQIGQLNPATIEPGAAFGTVAISDSTIAVAAAGDGYNYGVIYVYVKPSGGWAAMSPTATLSSTACCQNGATLRISSDGSTILASVFNGGFSSGGAIQLYERPTGGWQNISQPTAMLGSSGSQYDGRFMAISPDGKTIVSSDYFSWARKSYLLIYDRPASGWATMAPTNGILLNAKGTEPEAVAINSDNTIAVTNTPAGTIEVYQRGAGGIQEIASLSASDGIKFCCSVVMDANTILVEGFTSGVFSKVYLFSKPASGWTSITETAQLSSPTTDVGYFGWDMAKSGNAVLIGGLGTSAAYLYLEPAAGWQSTSQPNSTILSTDPNQQCFGDSVAILNNIMLVGDTCAGANDNQYGDAFIYEVQ